MLDAAAELYSDAFAPELFVLYCVVLLAGYEWRAGDAPLRQFGIRLGVVAAAWTLAYALYAGIPQLVDASGGWREDLVASVGLVAGLGLIWLAWNRRSWGDHVPRLASVLVVATVPHVLVVPLWDLSSHVLYTTASAGVLLAVDRRFLLLAVVPLGMVASRPLVGAHTWAQSVAGLLVGAAVVLAVLLARDRTARRATPA